MAEQRVYNLVRKTEYRSMGKTTVEVSTFSSRAAANAAMWDFTYDRWQKARDFSHGMNANDGKTAIRGGENYGPYC